MPHRSSFTPGFAARLAAALGLAVILAGCASSPRPADGPPPVTRPRPVAQPGPEAVADPVAVADAEPRVEPVRSGGANKPYTALGRDYVPQTRDLPYPERGLASWYGRAFHGRRTASGEVYDMYAMTAAHPTLPIPSYARVRNPVNGREVVVRINDRGPFHRDRILDLSYAAAKKLDLLRAVAPVEIERLTVADIRAGTWRRDGTTATVTTAIATSAPAAVALVSPVAPVAPPPTATAAVSSPLLFVAAEPVEIAADAVVAAPSPLPPAGFWVQLGAFRERPGAEAFQRHAAGAVASIAPWLATFAEAALYRVQAGPYPSRDDAQGAAQRIRDALGLVPVVVERR